ncbi:MAG: glycosyltransferase [Sulfuricellaceae bacterium]|nr:glycosyltransferase [Sulfuricellaceae bacterium]
MKPRVLISYFFGKDTIPLGASCAAGFRELGWDVYCFNSQAESLVNRYFLKWINKLFRLFGLRSVDVSRRTPWGNHNFRQHQLEKAVASFRPDVLLVIRGNNFDAEVIQRLKAHYGIRHTAGWWVKDPRATSEMLEDSRMYDHYFCIHRFGYGENDNIHCLPALGVDKALYRPFPGEKTYLHEVVFVGGWSPRRQEMMDALFDLPVEIYGPGWRKRRNWFNPELRKKVKANRIWGEDLIALYNNAKIVLNISSWDPTRTGLNLRVFDVPATGAFLLTDYSEELAQHFRIGGELDSFSTPEELRKKIIHYLGHDLEREEIAKAGYQKILHLESYADKMRNLLELSQDRCPEMKFLFNPTRGLQAQKEGFEAIGCELIENIWQTGRSDLKDCEACIIDFYEGIRHPFRTLRLKIHLQRYGIPLIAIDRDNPWYRGIRKRKLWLFRALGVLDIYASHSLQNADKFAPVALYLPNAVRSRIYNLAGRSLTDLREPGSYRYDVCFIGNLDVTRYREHRKRVAFLGELLSQLTALGVHCHFADSASLTPAEQVALIQQSRINLNYGAACDNGSERSWGLPERCYGIPACGGFLLSDSREHAKDDFAPKTEWASFDGMDDCIAKVRFYLAHFDLTRKIAEAAHQRVLCTHTYEIRARQILEAARAWRKKRSHEDAS